MQLLVERIILAVIALTLIICWTYSHFSGGKSMILVDGKPMVCVPTQKEAEAVLRQLKTKTGCNPNEIEFKQDVSVARAPRDVEPVSRHMAFRVMERVVSPVATRWAIIVNGKPVVAVPTREIAGEVLDLAKLKFGKMVPNLAEEPQFKENVTVDEAAVDLRTYRNTAEQAVNYLFSESTPITRDAVYIVKDGDVAGGIASKYGLKIEDMWAINPGVNLNHLQIGDKLRIKASESSGPKLTVVVRDQSERTETIPAPILRVSSTRLFSGNMIDLSPGRSGKQNVKVATIYENGKQVGSEILDEEIIRKPVPRQIAVGIKNR